MFGAHRASVYGNYLKARTMAFTAMAKYSVREAHARDCIGRLVLPPILLEEFRDY